MVVSWFAILLLVGLIGLVVLILGNRSARRVLAGLVIGVVVIFVFALLALVVMRTGVRRSTSSPSLSSRYQYPPEDEAMESHAVRGVTIGSNGDVVREGSSSIVVNGNGVSVTGGGQSINVSGDGLVMQRSRPERLSPPFSADRDQAAREVARVAEEVRAVADQVRAMSSRAGSQPARALAAGALEAPDPTLAPQPGESVGMGSVTDEWVDASQADFQADVYPSERSAAIAAARQMVRGWERILPAGQEPTQVLVSGDSELEPNVVPAVIQALRARLGDDRVEADKTSHGQYIEHVHNEVLSFNRGSQATAPAGSAPARLEADRTQIELLLEPAVREAQTRLRASEAGGSPASSAPAQVEADFTVHVLIKGDFSYAYGGKGVAPSLKRGGGISIEYAAASPAFRGSGGALFVNKMWVENGVDRASPTAGHEQIVARSKRLCPSRGEAEQQAIAEAAKNLVPLVRTALERLESSRVSQSNRGVIALQQHRPDPELYEKIRAELLRGTGVDDQFTQHIRRPYGDVWQHALLVNASDAQVTAHAAAFLPSIVQQHRAQALVRESWLIRAASLILLTVLITVVYGFLNAATRGYYTWMLRGSMVLLVLGGAVVLLLMT